MRARAGDRARAHASCRARRLHDETLAIARRWHRCRLVAIAAAKEAMRRGADLPLADALRIEQMIAARLCRRVSSMSVALGASTAEQRARALAAAAVVLGVAIVITLLVVAIGFAFDQGSERAVGRRYDGGPADEYQEALVIPVSDEHMFITRLQDGSSSPCTTSRRANRSCAAIAASQWDPTAPTGGAAQLAGFSAHSSRLRAEGPYGVARGRHVRIRQRLRKPRQVRNGSRWQGQPDRAVRIRAGARRAAASSVCRRSTSDVRQRRMRGVSRGGVRRDRG